MVKTAAVTLRLHPVDTLSLPQVTWLASPRSEAQALVLLLHGAPWWVFLQHSTTYCSTTLYHVEKIIFSASCNISAKMPHVVLLSGSAIFRYDFKKLCNQTEVKKEQKYASNTK